MKTYIFLRIIVIIFAALFLGLFAFMIVDHLATVDCQEYKTTCYRSEAVFGGVRDIQTRCSNDWDIQKRKCIDRVYFWENSNAN